MVANEVTPSMGEGWLEAEVSGWADAGEAAMDVALMGVPLAGSRREMTWMVLLVLAASAAGLMTTVEEEQGAGQGESKRVSRWASRESWK